MSYRFETLPEDLLRLALFAAANALTREGGPLAGVGLDWTQYRIMVGLWAEGPQTPARMAERLGAPVAALDRPLDRLEAAGLAIRLRDRGDRRVTRAAPTLAGAELETAATRAQQDLDGARLLSQADAAALRAALDALISQMTER